MQAETVRIDLGCGAGVSGLFLKPAGARAIYLFAHGAGAGMTHPFMNEVSVALAGARIATLRFNFPFMENLAGKRWARTDPPAVAQRVVRVAAACARELAPGLPLLAGGKSFGARMTSQAQAEQRIEGVTGLIFLGFPLHPAKKPSVTRADHLGAVQLPMLFMQGSRDALADLALVRSVCASLPTSRLHVVEGADHGFDVLARSGRTRSEVIDEIRDCASQWLAALL